MHSRSIIPLEIDLTTLSTEVLEQIQNRIYIVLLERDKEYGITMSGRDEGGKL